VQLFGGADISNEMPINGNFPDPRLLQIAEGTNQIQRSLFARNLLGAAGNTLPFPGLLARPGHRRCCCRQPPGERDLYYAFLFERHPPARGKRARVALGLCSD
jgi:Acyl-CoA dehydrogenase, C-terminal domain